MDLAAAGAVGAWFGLVAYIGRIRRAQSERLGLRCLIADCLVASAAADIALLACLATGASTTTTVLAVMIAGYSGQAAIDRIITQWIARGNPPSAD